MAPRRYFTSPELDRAAAVRSEPEVLERHLADRSSRGLVLCGGRVGLVTGDPDRALGWLSTGVLAGLAEPVFLGMAGASARFSFSVSEEDGARLASTHGLEFRSLRSVAALLDTDSAGLGAYAQAMDLWQRAHRFCGKCGGRNRPDQAGFRMVCEDCGNQQFPRLDPAIIVSVVHGDKLLLGRQPSWPKNRFSVLAGFVEPGETLESAVRREVLEESGVVVGHVDYCGSQPWPFPASLMVGFRATALDPKIERGDELEEVRWFAPAEALEAMAAGTLRLPPALSISRFLADQWLDEVCDADPALAKERSALDEVVW
ncbi:MAG: NAD(+) diphosphatase [Pseudomonadota bacterium]